MSDALQEEILRRFNFLSERESADCPAFNVPYEHHRDLFEPSKRDFDYDMLVDVTAIDGDRDTPRFTVIYHFFSTVSHQYLRFASNCTDDEMPSMPTVSDLWPAADWHEREVYDMFGIKFENHPNLRRILMWDSYPYYPLRKEFPLAGIEVDLPAADVASATDMSVEPAPIIVGPFHAKPGCAMSDAEPRASDQSWTEQRVKPTGGSR